MTHPVRLLFALAVAGAVAPAFAAGSTPGKFDECVQQGMKGQNESHLFATREACRQDFPPPAELKESVDYQPGALSYTRCKSGAGTVSVCLDKNDTGYEITGARLMLSEHPCATTSAAVKGAPHGLLAKEGDGDSSARKFTVRAAGAERFKCVYATWYGVKKQPAATARDDSARPLGDGPTLARD